MKPFSWTTGIAVHTARRDDVTIDDACAWVRSLTEPGARVLVAASAADRAVFSWLDDDSLIGCFEARACGPTVEVRWIHRRDGRGAAVAIVEGEHAGDEWNLVGGVVGAIDGHRQVIWGRVDDFDEVMARMSDARIGVFEIPRPDGVKIGDRAAICIREYVARDRHGNAYVVEERITGVEVAR